LSLVTGWAAIREELTWTSAPEANVEVLTMKRFRFRLLSLLWLVALVAAVLWGIRYRQDREARERVSIFRGGKTTVIELSPDSDFLANEKIEVYRGQGPSQGQDER
jgi:hypothetical protein